MYLLMPIAFIIYTRFDFMQVNLVPLVAASPTMPACRRKRLLETVTEQSNEISREQTDRLRASTCLPASKQASPFMIEKFEYGFDDSKADQMYMLVGDRVTPVDLKSTHVLTHSTAEVDVAYKTPQKQKTAVDKQSATKDSTSCKTGFFSVRKKVSKAESKEYTG